MTLYNNPYEYNAPTLLYSGGVYQLESGRTVCYHMNRLAGTLIKDIPQYDTQGAVTIWCIKNGVGNTGGGKIGNLNILYASRNGGKNYQWDIPGVLNGLAGTTGLGANEAASRIAS